MKIKMQFTMKQYKSSVIAFCKWFNTIFNTKTRPKKRNNHYEFYYSNKIVFIYLTKILKILIGKKSHKVFVPKYILSNNKKIKIAFLQGIFTFDGGVDYRNSYVSLTTKSKKLFFGVCKLLKGLEINPDYISTNSDKFGRYRLLIRKNEKLKLSINLFEKNTEKWYRLNEGIYGINSVNRFKKQKNITNLISTLNYLYPKKRHSAITFTDIINTLKEGKSMTINEIGESLKRRRTVINEFVSKLEHWNILTSEKENNKKLYKINKDLLGKEVKDNGGSIS